MSDNLNKKKLDARRISRQPWEQAYQRRKNAKTTKGEAMVPSFEAEQGATRHPGSKHLIRLSSNRSQAVILNKRKLESALLKMENAVLQNPTGGKGPIAFCREWEEKGKPIFNMVLALFSFSAKTKATVRRIMSGIDGVCGVSRESIVGSRE